MTFKSTKIAIKNHIYIFVKIIYVKLKHSYIIPVKKQKPKKAELMDKYKYTENFLALLNTKQFTILNYHPTKITTCITKD